ncbi:MAG: rhomboid family intramembrane serine protease [Chitinophagaceae bacterium]|nr:rhomboid family intramembrane serine protease [Chitinophagaceae bacterium]
MLQEDRYRKRMILGQDGNSLVMMMAILALVFCIFKFLYITYYLSGWSFDSYYKNIFNWFILPAEVGKLADRPWTILTYMFMHDGVFHLLGNVLWLWAFGFILQDLAGNSKLVPLFLYGGFAGALLFILANNIFPALSSRIDGRTLQGASAGVMAIAIATTTLAPDYRVFPLLNGGIPLWVITIIFIIVDFASIPEANGGGHIAHIGGAAIGFIFVLQLRKGRDWSAWMNRFFDWCTNLFNPDKKEWKKTAKKENYYNTKGTQPYKKVANVTQKRIDEILDKINQQGYRFLTDEEKEILKRASEDEPL